MQKFRPKIQNNLGLKMRYFEKKKDRSVGTILSVSRRIFVPVWTH